MTHSHHRRRRQPHSAAEFADEQSREGGRPAPLPLGGSAASSARTPDDDSLPDLGLQIIERVRPHLGSICVVTGAALAAMIAFGMVTSQREATRAQGWESCMAALSTGDAAAFSEVVRRFPGTDAARWAELLMADAAAAEGADLLFVDRQRAEGRLQAAAGMYAALLETRPRLLLAERVMFGLAKVRESLGQLEESRRGYEAVSTQFPGDAIAKLSADRASDLGRSAVQGWYDWFATQTFTAPVTAAPSGTPPASGPELPANVPPQPAAATGQP